MQADEGVEDEQTWPQVLDGLGEALAVLGKVEAEDGRGDDLHVEGIEAGSSGERDAFEAAAYDVQGILGGEEQDAALRDGLEAAEAGHARRDGYGHVEGEEGFATLGLAADDADGLGGPQSIDQPAALLGHDGERVGGTEGQKLGHRRARAACASLTVGAGLGRSRSGGAKISRNSFSSSCLASRSAPAARRSAAMPHRTR